MVSRYLVLAVVFSFLCFPVSAQTVDANDVSAFDVAELWVELQETEKILVDDNGHLYIADNEHTDNPVYEQLLSVVDYCNISIDEGIIIITSENGIALSEEVSNDYEQSFEKLTTYYSSQDSTATFSRETEDYNIANRAIDNSFHYIVDDEGSGHSCTAQHIDLLSICENNYQVIVNYYNNMMVLQIADPTFSAWTATAAFWVSKVKPNGPWDYKVSSTYGPYNNLLCACYGGHFHHLTAEYFGNMNYGYTGSFLFSLRILHFGSSAVSGFDAADEADWPAIDEGYYLKVNGQ